MASQSDLIPTNIIIGSTTITPGALLGVSWTLANQGAGAANSTSTTELRITSSPTLATGTNLAGVSTPALAGFSSTPQNAFLTVPSTPGTYYVWVIADDFSNVTNQSNTGNDLQHSQAFTVVAPNRAPVANNDSYSTLANTPLAISSPGILGNDTDADGNSLSAYLNSFPTHGALSLSTNGSFTYTPNSGYVGSDSFTYYAYDGTTESLSPATVSITVSGSQNHTPTATGHDQSAAPGTSIPLSTLFTYSDADGPSDIVGFAVQDVTSGGGHLTLNGVPQADNTVFGNSTFGISISQIGQWAYVVGASGSVDTVDFDAIDSHGAYNSPAAVARVTAQSGNHSPTAAGHDQTARPGTSIPLSTLFTYSDPDGASDIVGFSVQDTTSGGSYLTLNGMRQADNFVFGNSMFGIPISQIGQWAYVVGASGSVDRVDFNVIDSHGAFNLPAVRANVTAHNGLVIHLIPDDSVAHAPTGFIDAVQAAADIIQNSFSDNITLNIRYGWGTLNNVVDNSLTGAAAAEARADPNDPVSTYTVPYTSVSSWLGNASLRSNDDRTAIRPSFLPNGQTNLFVTSAQEKALGQLAGNANDPNGPIDGAIGFGTMTTAPYWTTEALHEITHAMGRVTGYYESNTPTIMDLYRYGSPGQLQWTPDAPAYFSLDGGNSRLASFSLSAEAVRNNSAETDYSDWLADNLTTNDPFNAFVSSSPVNSLTLTDRREMDVLGFTLASGGSGNGTSFADPAPQLSAFAPTTGWSSEVTYPRELADVDGDGMADIVGFGANGAWVSLATGNGHFGAPVFESTAFAPTTGWNSNTTYPRELADVNGDHMADIVGFGASGVWVALATGGGGFAAPVFESTAFAPTTGWNSDVTYPRELADVNGDHMADIVAFGSMGVWVSLATGGGGFATPVFESTAFAPTTGWNNNDQYPRELADVNGDHMADIVGFGATGVWVSLASGGGGFATPVFESTAFAPTTGWNSNDQYPRELADINGDHMADIVGFGATGVWVSLATGNGQFAAPAFDLPLLAQSDGWSNQTSFPRELADVTGDHHADIVGFGSTGVWVSQHG